MYFTAVDYALFAGMLVLSALVGLYFGFCSKRKQDNPLEYLLGNRSMKIFPVAMSLTATHISAVTILGVPAEMYSYGIQYWATAISGLIITIVTAYFFLPVFYDLQIISCFTYLERRFGQRVCSLASGIYTLAIVVHLPLLVYAPALAFSQVTGVNLYVITPITCVICIFYTTFGGLRAVVWTDTLQFGSMIGALFAVMYLGTSKLGGVSEVFKIADRGGRLIFFDFDADPLARSSFWAITVGLTVTWVTSLGITPESVQRLVSVPSLAAAQKTCWIMGIGHILIKLFSVYNGLLIYGQYEKCDPVIDNHVAKADQIFPYYIMDVGGAIPGLPGLFVAGVFSAALSSMSSCLNTLSGTLYTDFIKPRYPTMKERNASVVMKCLVALIGAICVALIFLVERLSNIFSLGITISGITAGVYLGAFTMGLLFPRANAKGVLYGSYAAIVIVAIVAIGAQLNVMAGNLKYPTLPFRTDGCSSNLDFQDSLNSTSSTPSEEFVHIVNENHDNTKVLWPFRLSFMYYSLLGTLVVYLVGLPVSYFTSSEEDLCELDERLLTPVMRPSLRRRKAKVQQEKRNVAATELKQLWMEKPKTDAKE